MPPTAQPQTPTLNFEALKAVDDGGFQAVVPADARSDPANTIGATIYRLAWTVMFTVALGYIGAVAFKPSFLPLPMQVDIDDPARVMTSSNPEQPTVPPQGATEPPVELTSPQLSPPTIAPADLTPLTPTLINAAPETKTPQPLTTDAKPWDPPRPRRDATAADVAATQDTKPPPGIAPTRIETGTLPKPQTIAAPARGFGVQIGNAPSLDTLRLVWSRMVERHRTQLSGIEPRFIASDTNSYVLVAGPFVSENDARRVCADLITRRDPCKVRDYAGDGLF